MDLLQYAFVCFFRFYSFSRNVSKYYCVVMDAVALWECYSKASFSSFSSST